MKKKVMIGLISGLVVIIIAMVLILTINPTGNPVKELEENSEENIVQNIFDNVVLSPSPIGISFKPGEEKIEILEITNNNDQTLFFRCGIYNEDSSKYAPQSTCKAQDGEEGALGFIEIPAKAKKTFSIKTTTKKNHQHMSPEGEGFTVTTNSGTYNNKVLIAAGTQAEEQEVKEILLTILVE